MKSGTKSLSQKVRTVEKVSRLRQEDMNAHLHGVVPHGAVPHGTVPHRLLL